MSTSESERPTEPESNPRAPAEAEAQTESQSASQAEPSARPSKPPVSPVRKAISVVALVVLLGVLGSEIWALYRFNTGVGALERAIEASETALVEIEEAERLLGHSGDGPLQETGSRQLKKTYTWSGPIRTHAVAVYYSDGVTRGVIRYEIEGAEPVEPAEPVAPSRPAGPSGPTPPAGPSGPTPPAGPSGPTPPAGPTE